MKIKPVKFIAMIITVITGCSNITDGLHHQKGISSGELLFDYSITINNFHDITYTRDAVISINPGNATLMRFSNDGINWSAWETAAESRAWVLTEYSSVKTVYAEFGRDGGTISSAYDDIEFIEKLLPVTFTDNDSFGTSLAVSSDGGTVVMGGDNFAYTNNSGFTYRPGGAIVCRYDEIRWNSTHLVPGGTSGSDKFGASVSISGDGNLLIAGSPGYNSNCGRVLMYRYNGDSGQWEFIASITGSGNSYFGNSVALSRDGHYVVCAAIYGNTRKGEALLYSVSSSGFSYIRTFRADDGLAEDRFGCSVSVNSDASIIVVGAEQHRVGSYTGSGIIYVFKNAGGSYEQRAIQCSNPDYNAYFGCSTSISGNGNVIGAGARGYLHEQGKVYVFRLNELNRVYVQYDVTDEAGNAGDQFGYSVALSGDGSTLIAGSPYADNGITDSGKLVRYDFNGSNYSMTDVYCPADPSFEKHIGVSAAINDSGSLYISGAIKDLYSGKCCGTSYVYRR